ncbi:MAG: hypothetical protein JO256_00130 [Alphaproteobacteria bacterium]|nr:hypothetical protein [Alphaproteobacteria bacterium]
MTTHAFSKHGLARLKQRGIALNDLELLELIGSEVENGYLVRRKDYQVLDREVKHLLHRARRLVGKRVVVENGTLVTAYHASQKTSDRLLRNQS